MTIFELKKIDLYEKFVSMISNEENFTFVRYGDGEWACMLDLEPHLGVIRKRHAPSDPAIFGKRLLKQLKTKPGYFVGIQPMAYKNWSDLIDPIIEGTKICNADCFHIASMTEKENLFFDVIREKSKTSRIIFIGPNYLKGLGFSAEYYPTPLNNSWDHFQNLESDIRALIEKDLTRHTVIFYSCSLTAKYLMYTFWNLFGDKITQIDTGSFWDPFCGINSRKYHSNILDRLKKN